MTARLYSLHPIPLATGKFRPKTLAGHRDAVVAAYWSEDETEIYTVGRDGSCFVWRGKEIDIKDEEETDEDDDDDRIHAQALTSTSAPPRIATTRWGLSSRNYFHKVSTSVVCTAFHPSTSLLVVGFASGVFGLYTLPDFSSLHTLSISSEKITSVCTSADGAWLAFGCAGMGQLLVWEWASESYILKQQGHFHDMNTLAYSPDGQLVATGGDDGKLKLWNVSSGFCIATLSEHSAPITAIEFAKKGKVLFSASMDGTVRAWDLVRYRNFRTLTSPRPVQFGCLAIEGSGEIVCAGSGGGGDTFDIYMWSVQSGKLLDTLSGHSGPVSSLAFSPTGSGTLASTSWDKTVKIWECFKGTSAVDTLHLNSDGLAVTYRHDGAEICVASLDGQLSFFDPREGSKQNGVLECRRDIAPGRRIDDKVSAKANAGGSCFNTVTYSADGTCVLAGGNSNWVCLYDIGEKVLLKRWQLSLDLSLDGTQDRLDSRQLTKEGKHVDLIDDVEDEDELTLAERIDRSLPGTKKADLAQRKTRATTRCKSIQFCPTGVSWAAACTSGLLIYSLEAKSASGMGGGIDTFDPIDLDIDLTPENVRSSMHEGNSLTALIGALRLGDAQLLVEVYENVLPKDINLLVSQLPPMYLGKVLKLVASRMAPATDSQNKGTITTVGGSPHIEFHLLWLSSLLAIHGATLRKQSQSGKVAPTLRSVAGALNDLSSNISKVADDNSHLMLYLWGAMQQQTIPQS
jgi:periodic tryptophan protein 2